MKKILPLLAFSLIPAALLAQDSTAAADRVATGLRAGGKIYVVVAVVVTILLGLFAYVIRLDRKISRMEKGSAPR